MQVAKKWSELSPLGVSLTWRKMRYIVLLFINIFLLYHKKLDKMHKEKSDVEAKYFCQLTNISLSNLLKFLTTTASK